MGIFKVVIRSQGRTTLKQEMFQMNTRKKGICNFLYCHLTLRHLDYTMSDCPNSMEHPRESTFIHKKLNFYAAVLLTVVAINICA